MKQLYILLLLPLGVCAQVEMEITPGSIITAPGEQQPLFSMRLTASEPVRLQECHLSFIDSNFFSVVDRVIIQSDAYQVPLLMHSGDFLTNPMVHYPSVYVGIADDTVHVLDYKVDVIGDYVGTLDLEVVCWCRLYTRPNQDVVQLGPSHITQSVMLNTSEIQNSEVVKVISLPGIIDITINARICEPILVIDQIGKTVDVLYSSKKIYVPAGFYFLYSEPYGYIGAYIVR